MVPTMATKANKVLTIAVDSQGFSRNIVTAKTIGKAAYINFMEKSHKCLKASTALDIPVLIPSAILNIGSKRSLNWEMRGLALFMVSAA